MVERFLAWRLPEDFHPDAGISFKPTFNDHLPEPMKHNPTGTNLFDYTQAEAMVRHMVESMPGWPLAEMLLSGTITLYSDDEGHKVSILTDSRDEAEGLMNALESAAAQGIVTE